MTHEGSGLARLGGPVDLRRLLGAALPLLQQALPFGPAPRYLFHGRLDPLIERSVRLIQEVDETLVERTLLADQFV